MKHLAARRQFAAAPEPVDEDVSLHVSAEEARWLVTAIGIAERLLEGLEFDEGHGQWYQLNGLAALHRIADRLPRGLRGYYP